MSEDLKYTILYYDCGGDEYLGNCVISCVLFLFFQYINKTEFIVMFIPHTDT